MNTDKPRERTFPRTEVFAEIDRLGLSANVLELESEGYTVVPSVLDADTIARAQDAILNQLERKTGSRPDLKTYDGPALPLAHFLLFEDEVFEQILMNEVMLALMAYLLGQSMTISSMTSHVKASANPHLPLHSDTPGMTPFRSESIVANCNFALDDYTKENGCLAIIPSTHRLGRNPTGDENNPHTNPFVVPVEVPIGSAIIYHGNTWHGAFKREAPGVRLNLAVFMARNFITRQERIKENVTTEMIERNGERFARLCSLYEFNGYEEEGPDFAKAAKYPGFLIDPRFG
ncbi:MAG: phytanoyl-CoA dioxygenase family protein [Pseudomonadota bacterium]